VLGTPIAVVFVTGTEQVRRPPQNFGVMAMFAQRLNARCGSNGLFYPYHLDFTSVPSASLL
jgi:hypothetical protein